jgi:antitoxin (DNA-binding transcriptional repressor) of toxin-antitoxin stability system
MSATDDAASPPPPVREISTRQLGKQLSAIIAEVAETGVTIVVTRGGTPVACLGPLPVTA